MRRLGSRDFFMLLLLAMMAFFTFSALQQVNRGDAPTYSQIRELFHLSLIHISEPTRPY